MNFMPMKSHLNIGKAVMQILTNKNNSMDKKKSFHSDGQTR